MENAAALKGNTGFRSSVNAHLNAIINAFTSGLLLTGMGVLLGVVLKLMHLIGQDVVFVFSLSVMALLLILQIGLSLVYIFSHLRLALLGAFSSLANAMACLSLVFLFEQWWGSSLMIFLTTPIFVLSVVFLIAYFLVGEHRHTTHRKFLYLNILLPFLFVLALGIVYAVWSGKQENEEVPDPNSAIAVTGNSFTAWKY
ncbi:hypothetical protein [Adhaeribacter aquaticus]|uniref:hypothetical protein n=1 Tax=Adhaeribacter aquaticus TaxID=299567 RepID=UPI00040D73F4|nr:hypothetical protein [Adhaeribacter aquaticus]